MFCPLQIEALSGQTAQKRLNGYQGVPYYVHRWLVKPATGQTYGYTVRAVCVREDALSDLVYLNAQMHGGQYCSVTRWRW